MYKIKRSKFFIVILFTIALFACEQDELMTILTSDLEVIIDENPQQGQILGTIEASANEADLRFRINTEQPADAFDLDSITGELSVKNGLLFDYEINPVLTALVDVSNGNTSVQSSVTVRLVNAPITTLNPDFEVTIDENPQQGQILGTIEASANEGDLSLSLTYSLNTQQPANAFDLHASTGELSVKNELLFDYETNPILTAIVDVSNGISSVQTSVTVRLADETTTVFSEDQGLPNGNVRDICQDNEGHIWLATEGGLIRSDGNSWRSYTTEDGLVSNDIRAVESDQNNNIWFVSRSGVQVLDQATQSIKKVNISSSEPARYDNVQIGQNNTVWIHRFHSEIHKVNIETMEVETIPCKRGFDCWRIEVDRNGAVVTQLMEWVVFGAGIANSGYLWRGFARFNGEIWEDLTPEGDLRRTFSMYFDEQNHLWAGIRGGWRDGGNKDAKLYYYDGENRSADTFESAAAVNAIVQSKNGDILFAPTNLGLMKKRGNTLETLLTKEMIPGQINNLLKDSRGDIWIATSNGVVKYDF